MGRDRARIAARQIQCERSGECCGAGVVAADQGHRHLRLAGQDTFRQVSDAEKDLVEARFAELDTSELGDRGIGVKRMGPRRQVSHFCASPAWCDAALSGPLPEPDLARDKRRFLTPVPPA